MDRSSGKAPWTRIGLLGMMVVAALVLSACARAPALPSAGQGATPTPSQPQADTPPPQPTAGLPTGALPAAEALAQQLNVQVGSVTVVSVEKVDWPDACLGVATPGMMCAQVVTPGYRVILEAQGQRYEYHTDLNGTQAKPALAPEPEANSEVALTWHREGGIAGFCDDLTVSLSGDVRALSCKGGAAKAVGQARLSPQDLQKLNNWVGHLDSFEYTQTDQAKADAMTIRVAFTGQGDAAASDAEKQDIQAWAAQLFTTASAQ